MKKALVTGLIILLPIAITAYIVVVIVDFFTEPFTQFVTHLLAAETSSHKFLISLVSRIIILVALYLSIVILGFLAERFFFHHFLALAEKIFARIPVVKTIYNIVSEAAKAMLNPGQKAFKSTVLIPFPSQNTYSLGLVTGTRPEGLSKVLAENNLSVFIPTAPHPVSGYVLFAPKEQLVDIPITTEETIAFLISCGTTFPPEQKPRPHSK